MQRLASIDRLETLHTLAEPHRFEILRRILEAPSTISSLGIAMGQHPAWVRHHVKALESVGLIRLTEERTTRNYTEKFYGATASAFTVSLLVRPGVGDRSRILAMVSDDFAVEALAAGLDDRVHLSTAVTGSLDGLVGLRQGLADIAGCHLLDVDTGEYNVPYVRHFFPDRDIAVVTVAHREQGLIVARGNRLSLHTLEDVVEKRARFVNRNRGSGTRIWLDRELTTLGLKPQSLVGYDVQVDTHDAAAALIAAGRADAAVCVAVAAEHHDLDFVPLFRERYDLVMTKEVYESEEVSRLLTRMHTRPFKRIVAGLSGYDSASTGDETLVAV
ncbi:MAG: substrate-binding domain-containing protein [Coriobacteriia bacterium]|nr:substrate-binding domain-containing protein [Coriobacteriia bacterium]